LGGTRVVILGSGNVGLELAQQLLQSGLDIAAIVEVSRTIRGDAKLAERLKAAGVPILLSSVIEAALGDSELKAIQLRSVDENMEPLPNSGQMIECDTLCMAFGLVPNIELAAQTGCQIEYRTARGGWVPIVDADMRTSIPYIHVVGDGAGVNESSRTDTTLAIAQARRAAQAIVEGKRAETDVPSSPRDLEAGSAPLTPAHEWLRALTAVGGLDVVVCQCEDVTRRDVLGVRAPRYLNAPDERRAGTVTSLNCFSQDFVKRMTRAGMGHCQGKRCRDQTALLLASQCADSRLENIIPGSFRAPVRPLPLNVVAGADEPEEIGLNWPCWFQPLNEGEIT
jgi:NADPH-dependent 2,4-dienoyl-CoA reductase/sulfur reductase-like enzyme